MATIPSDVRDREAAALADLYARRTQLKQAEFAKAVGLSGAAMVYQYLHGVRPLNLIAASQFARGLGVPIRTFSPRLDLEFREIARSVHGAPPAIHALHAAHEPTSADSAWPFPTVDARKLADVRADDLLRLEGALLAVAFQLGIDIRKSAAA